MWAVYLKLLLSTALTFVVANYDVEEQIKNCKLTSYQFYVHFNKVVPIKYDVRLTLIPHHKNISGVTDITINIKVLTKYIVLNARHLDVDPKSVNIVYFDKWLEDTTPKLEKLVFCPKYEILAMIFKQNISPKKYILHMEHHSLFDENVNKTIYQYYLEGMDSRWIVTNLYERTATRRLFPCWDEPTIKASFRISVKHDISFKVFSNTLQLDATKEANNFQWTNFDETSPISTSSLSIVMVHDIIQDCEKKLQALWHRPDEIFTKKYRYAYNVTDRVTFYYSFMYLIDMEGRIGNINHVILPSSLIKSAGRPGVALYREEDVIYPNYLNFPGEEIRISRLVAYEMARQVYVGYVGSNFTSNLWINEILASFDSYFIIGQAYPGMDRLIDLFVVQNTQTALDSDVFLEQECVIREAKGDTGIDGILYPLLYDKKAFAVIRMLFHLLTHYQFTKAIRKYVHSRTTDLWTILHEEYTPIYRPFTMQRIIESSLLEKHHHEIHVSDYVSSGIRYMTLYTLGTSCKSSETCVIPITYATEINLNSYDITKVLWYSGGNHSYMVDHSSVNQFLLVNLELVGYYRVNYDERNWHLLSAFLQSDKSTQIPALNRAQLVSDAFHFMLKGKLKSAIFFEIIKFLKYETDYIVWYPMFNILSYMSSYLKCPNANVTKANFVDILHGLLRNVGYEKQVEEVMKMPLRLLAIKWACELGHRGCRKATTEKLIAHIRAPAYQFRYLGSFHTHPSRPWFQNWMYCTGIIGANMDVWEEVLHDAIRYKDMKLLEYLTCSENTTIILHYMDLILDENLGKEENLPMGKIYQCIAKRHAEKEEIWRYVLDNYIKIVNSFPHEFNNVSLLSNLIVNAYSIEQLEQVKSLTEKENLKVLHDLWWTFYDIILKREKQLRRLQYKFKMLKPSQGEN